MKPKTANTLGGKALDVYDWLREKTDLVTLPSLAIIIVTTWPAVELADEAAEGTTRQYGEWVLLAHTSTHYRCKLYFLTIAAPVTILIGLTRIYLGVHYSTDVLAGWSFRLIWALTCWLVAHYLRKRGTVEPPQEPA